MNPYAGYLGALDPLDVIAETPKRLAEAVAWLGDISPEYRPAEDKWNAREVVCHLADTEIVFAFRLRQAIAELHHVIQPFEQDNWAKSYWAYDIRSALEVFATVRSWNLTLIESVTPDGYAKLLTHPERGTMTFQTLVETMAGHDLNHLGQIKSLETTQIR